MIYVYYFCNYPKASQNNQRLYEMFCVNRNCNIYLKSYEKVTQYKGRPQSAKPGYRGYWGQASNDQIDQQRVAGK